MSVASRLAQWWQLSLKRRPILTNTAVYATFYTAAELSQQAYNKYYTDEKPEMDFAAAGRLAAAGSTVYAPALYVWYKFLDRSFAGTAMKAVMTKVVADQLIMTPLLLATFYSFLGVLDQREDIFEEVKTKYLKTLIANQAFFVPAQIVNFSFIPSHLRVVYVASVSFIWINILCYIKRQKVDVIKISETTEVTEETND